MPAADDVLDAEEGFDDMPDSSHDYADLAAAMGGRGDESDEEEDGPSSVGSEEEDLPGDDESDSAAADEDDLEMGTDADSAEDDDLMLSEANQADSDGASGADDEDLNPFDLAAATDSEEEQQQTGRRSCSPAHRHCQI